MKSRAGCVVGLVALVAAIGLAAWFFLAPAPLSPSRPLTEGRSWREMLPLVPPDATEIAVIPSSGPLLRIASKNPVTAPSIDAWRDDNSIPVHPLLLGNSTLLLWRSPSSRGAVAAPDAVRRLLLRAALSIGGETRAAVRGPFVLIGSTGAAVGPPSWAASAIALGTDLPGQLFFLQGPDSHAGYPPVGRPSFTSANLDHDDVLLASRARGRGTSVPDTTVQTRFPRNALITIAAAHPPDALRTIARSFPVDILPLLESGAAVSIYKVDERKLIPRIHAALVLPLSAEPSLMKALDTGPVSGLLGGIQELGEQKRVVGGVEVVRRRGLGYTVEYAKRGSEFVVGFDKSSVDQYLTDVPVPSALGARPTAWTIRIQPALLGPVLDKLAGAEQVRLLAPDLHRTILNLQKWTSQLRNASSLTVARSTEGEMDVVRAAIEGPK